MTDISADTATATTDGRPNIVEYSVSEVSQAVKRTLEGAFEHVRVRGEVGRPNYHGSGHLYFTLKDESAALDAVCWRGTVARLSLRVEEGMEVICTGRISSYPRSSRYQIVIESVELAGEGALLKLLEDRRKKLAAEGLFDAERKKPLPFVPSVIGVVTSPTGAVIRDILHRLDDRFPRHVILWPVPVQGEGAAEKIAAAIEGFNALEADGPIARPDLLIVGRGGGSIEDLWAFNEEIVVRAAAASDIPLISAVGHETDTTLIDFVSDYRAPTPTGAAERAVPVRAELLAQVLDDGQRLVAAMARMVEERRLRIEGLARGLPEPRRLFEGADQRLDNATDRLAVAIRNDVERRQAIVDRLGAEMPRPRDLMDKAEVKLGQFAERLPGALGRTLDAKRMRYEALSVEERLTRGISRASEDGAQRLDRAGRLLESLSYKGVLARGYSVVRDAAGEVIARAADTVPGSDVSIEFADASVGATVNGEGKAAPKKRPSRKESRVSSDQQGKLL